MLYQKHRPKDFTEIVGNREVVVTLTHMLRDKESMPHAFLFQGETGCGKTTLARIVANELGCKPKNLHEIDTAQFTGIDTVRDIRKGAQYLPLGGGISFYIIDEVHRMTNDAQNAFLKILEDTPPHVYFALCTTNEKSLLPTIRGRCSTFEVKPLTDVQMVGLLNGVAKKEGGELEEKVAEMIARSAQGHARNALTILGQVLATPERKRLQVAERAQIVEAETKELCQLLLKKATWNKIKVVLKGLKGHDAENIRRAVLGYAQAVLLNSGDPYVAHIMEQFEEPFYNIGFPGVTLACYRCITTFGD